MTFNFGLDAEATTRQYAITFGLALSAKIAAAIAREMKISRLAFRDWNASFVEPGYDS